MAAEGRLGIVLPESEPSCDPTIAVVICTRDRPLALAETLESIWRQTRLPDELVVIDDGRLADDVQDGLAEQCRRRGIVWRYERSRSRGLTAARNQAADMAASDVLQYLDDDVTCSPGFLAEVGRVMADPRVGGATAVVEEPTFSGRTSRLYQFGYCVAGWWRASPRARPPGPRPSVLGRPAVAVRARWLSGAAMALRRDVVREHRFDEGLTEYALGEDREMSYRLAPHCWLVEARRARVVHRRDVTQRTDARRLGYMTSFNYLRILRKTCRLGAGDWVVICWGLAVLAVMHAVWSLGRSRRAHLGELRGMLDGLVAALRLRGGGVPARDCYWGRFGLIPVGHGGPTLQEAPARRRCHSDEPPAGRRCHSLGMRSEVDGRRGLAEPAAGLPADIWTPPLTIEATSRDALRDVRVLFVTNRLEAGGAERMLLSLVEYLRRFGIRSFVGCLKDAGPLAGSCRGLGIPVFDGLLRLKTDVGVLVRMRRIVAENRINVIVAAHSGGDRMFWSTLAGRLSGVPVVVWSHWFPSPGAAHFERANRMLYRQVGAYVALGEAQRLAMIRHEHVPAGRIAVVHNGIEPGPFAVVSRADARRSLDLDERHVAVAIIANLRREKRHDVFIEAARRLAAGNDALRFFVIGDGPERRVVETLVAASGLDDETMRLMGTREDVAALLPGIDICCLCSETECFSLTMLEASAAGCAFIGPAVGCMTEFLDHRRTGLVIRPADVDSLADAIMELVADEALRNRLARAARERVIGEYGVRDMAGRFSGLLARVVGRV